jgi:HPt (histidine-containing phosphotransfer) domain-containing protein
MTQPSQPLGMSDFFALEAGEYLDRLDALLQGDAAPAADEFVRLARALRGSALMASQQPIARAASGLESLARAVREGRRSWDPSTKQVAVRTVDDLKIFVRRATSWTEADTAKAEALAAQLEQLAGRPSAQVRAAEALGLDAGARAFVAREGAAIASALDRAAQVLRSNPLAHDPLQHVLKALQPLRGLAALNDLPPLPDLLEGIERAIGELARSSAAPGALVGELFQSAAASIAHAARQVAERGRPDPEGAEFRRFATLLMQFMESEPDVVPVNTLFYGDGGPDVVRRGTSAARPPTLGRLELVSQGEHLRQAADSLERAPSPTQRELRAHTLGGTFRALGGAGGGEGSGGPVGDRVAEFAQAAREAVASGVAVQQAVAFAAQLRRAGDVLSRSASGDEAALAAELAAVTAAVRALGGSGGAAPAPPVVPIASLAPAAAAPAPRSPLPARPGSDPPVPESGDLVGSWAAYQRLVAAGVGPASLDELLRAPSLDTTRPAAAAPRGDQEPPLVDIRTLVYRGERARLRAQELREAAARVTGDGLRTIIDEVCDLVVLALEPEP